MTIYVAHIRAHKTSGGEQVDRSTLLGNPFVIGRDGTRTQVINKFRRWAAGEMRSNPRGNFAKAFEALERRIRDRERRKEDTFLLCWCAPEACHADVLRAMLIRRRRWKLVA